MKSKIFFAVFYIIIIFNVNAAIVVDFANNFTSYSGKESTNTEKVYKDMINRFALSAKLNTSGSLNFGYNIELLTKTFSKDTLNITSMEPKIDYFFSSFFLSAVWMPYVSGKRIISTLSNSISGSSIGMTFGYIKKFGKHFLLGASITYNSISINKKTS